MGLSKMFIYIYIYIITSVYSIKYITPPPPENYQLSPKKILSFMAWLRWIHFPFQKANRVPKLLQTANGSGRMSGWMVMVRFAVKLAGGSSCKLSCSFNPMRMILAHNYSQDLMSQNSGHVSSIAVISL